MANNMDRIRSMNDEEMDKWIMKVIVDGGCSICSYSDKLNLSICRREDGKSCNDGIRKWLKDECI